MCKTYSSWGTHISPIEETPVYHVCVYGHHLKRIGHQASMVVNPSRGQLNRENKPLLCPFASSRIITVTKSRRRCFMELSNGKVLEMTYVCPSS